MRLCDWFAGIDVGASDISAAFGSSSGTSEARVHGSRSFPVGSGSERDRSLRDIGEWLRLESGDGLRELAVAIPGDAIREVAASGACRFSEPTIVDHEIIELTRQQALRSAGESGLVLSSVVRGFSCDGRRFPEAPYSLSVRTLSADLVAWIAEPSFLRFVSDLLDGIGFQTGMIVPRAVALAEAALSPAARERGALVLSVNERFTEVAVYRNAQLDDLFVVPLGKERLDAKVAGACGLPVELARRIDLRRMLESREADPIVHRVRTIVSAWSLSLMRAVRQRLDTNGPAWELRSGVVIADSAQALPLLAEATSRAIGLPARYVAAAPALDDRNGGEPLAAHGLIGLQWQFGKRPDAEGRAVPMLVDDGVEIEPDAASQAHGIAPVIARWLREFVPAAHAP